MSQRWRRFVQSFLTQSKYGSSAVATYGVAGATVGVLAYSHLNKIETPLLLDNSSRKYNSIPLTRNFIADAVEKALPAVVNISVESGMMMGNGSGFLISSDGLIVTNAHVVASHSRYSKIHVTFANGKSYPASIHSGDALSDIAILQIEDQDTKNHKRHWPAITFGSSADLRPGEWVCALGSPFTLQNSVSAGIVSAVARHSSELGVAHTRREFIQTDAAINSGNSGGPLINLDGKVIGINTMKVQGSHGISFAIPIDIAAQVIEQLKKHKKVIRPYLGFQMINFNSREFDEIARAFPDVEEGVIIKSVTPCSPAQKAGLQPGDIIISFDHKPIQSSKDILNTIGYDIGREILIEVKKSGEKVPRKLKVITEPLPENFII